MLSDDSPITPILQNTSSKLNGNQYDNKTNEYPLVINILYTQYEIIHDVAIHCNLRTSVDEEEDWDIWFIDGPIIPSLL